MGKMYLQFPPHLKRVLKLIIYFCHLLIILSHRLAQASLLAPFSYFEIITNTLIAFYVFSEFPDRVSWLGIFIIIGSGIYVSWRERKAEG